jgi:UDP-glucose 4-epimerase
MKKVLVLGGGGFIGRHLIKNLSGRYDICVFDYQTKHLEEEFPDIKLNSGLFADANFEMLLAGVDIVYHLISTTIPFDGTANSIKELTDNVVPTIKLLNAMAAMNTKRIIFVSSAGTIYGEAPETTTELSRENPQCSYGIQKLCIEKYLALYERYFGFAAITARLTNPYGTGQAPKKRQGSIPIFTRAVLKGDPIEIWGDGYTIRDYIHIDDAVSGLMSLAEYEGSHRLFNISSGEEWSLLQIIEMLESKTHKKANVTFKAPRLCDIKRSSVDSSLIRHEIGWAPRHTLGSSIDALIGTLP